MNGTGQPPDGGAGPRMSIILVTDCYRTIRPVIERLQSQTLRGHIEIVIVAPSGQALGLDPSAVEGFGGIRVVEVNSILPLGPARAAGVRIATAPIVVIGETHSFPQPGWAEALLKAHSQQPWAVVVPSFGNANPEGALSWAAFLRDYGRWVNGLTAGEIDFVPPYNTATKREVLLKFGDSLERAVAQGDALASGLRAMGHRTYFEPAARIDHANISRPLPWLAQRVLVGRVIAANRAIRWSSARRLMYACSGPLIAVVVLSRLIGPVRLMRRTQRLPTGTVLALVLGVIASAAGEVIGYVTGGGPEITLRSDTYELYKLRYTSLPAP